MTLTPAYGKDYKSKKKVEAAFREGEDFHMIDIVKGLSGYCSIRDFQPGDEVTIRYKKLTQVHIFKV